VKINFRSISTKLMVTGVAAVVIPLIIVGYLSYSKAHTALTELSINQTRSVATDLALLSRSLLEAEMHKVGIMASQRPLVELGTSLQDYGLEMSRARVDGVIIAFKRQFESMGGAYEGLFIADSDGLIVAGVLDNGKEYDLTDIADRDYFRRAKEGRTAVMSDMHRSAISGMPIAVAGAPILAQNGEFLGSFGLCDQSPLFCPADSRSQDRPHGVWVHDRS
jgi:methyl-accepting chemotaxis protein